MINSTRLQATDDPMFANEIRWQPAYKQLLEVRVRLVDYKLGTPLSALSWPTAFLSLFLMFKFTKNAKNLNLRRRQM